MIFLEQPADFKPRIEAASCFVEHNGKFLLLRRSAKSYEANRWAIPAGKLEHAEDSRVAIIRELREESGIVVHMSKLHFFKTIFLRYPDRDVVFHIYYYYCDESPEVTLSEEHVAYTWVTPQGALLMSDLMIDLDGCIKLFYRI